jgi:hypothetical protein
MPVPDVIPLMIFLFSNHKFKSSDRKLTTVDWQRQYKCSKQINSILDLNLPIECRSSVQVLIDLITFAKTFAVYLK